MAIRAPWKGWLRTAMPCITFFILLNALIVLLLAVTNVAALDLDHEPKNVTSRAISIRITLFFFWCMIPLFLFFTSVAENWCLWTDRLGATYVILSSLGAIGLWIVQVVLWGPCVLDTQNGVAGYCPYIYQHGGWGQYPDWAFSSPNGALYAVPTLLILYLVQMCFAATVYRRQQRQSFRKSDMSQTWIRRLEEGDSDVRLVIPDPLEDRNATPLAERRLTSDTIRSSEDGEHTPRAGSRRTTITAGWLTPLEPTASRSPSSRRSTVSSVTDNATTPTISERSFPPLSERGWSQLPDQSGRRRSSSVSRYYSEYSVSEISQAEQDHATPGSRPSEENLRVERRRSSGVRDLLLTRSRDSLGDRRSAS